MASKDKSAAVLTLHAPGEMTPEGRKEIADWLREQAKNLVKYGGNYSRTIFRARYLYADT